MLQDTIHDIIYLFFINEHDCSDNNEIQKWVISDADFSDKDRSLYQIWQSLQIVPDKQVYRLLKSVKKTLGMTAQKPAARTVSLSRHFMRIAAVIIPLIAIIGSYFYLNYSPAVETPAPLVVQMVEIYAPEGEMRHITLPDGTEAWLKSESTIKYSENFEGQERRAQLTGSVYLDVAKDSLKPFILDAEHFSVTVLGTEFEVRAYPLEENSTVTLYNGKVKAHTQSGQVCELEPNQQLVFNNRTGELGINNICEATERVFANWRKGEIVFNQATLSEIIETLEYHYNISIKVEEPLLTTEYYTVKFINNESVSQSLNVLKDLLGNFSYRIKTNESNVR